MRYKDYREHYRLDGEVFDFEREIEPTHRQSVLRLQQHMLRTADLEGTESVLDVGCGSGWMLRTLARTGMRSLYGVDLSRGQYVKGTGERNSEASFVEGDTYFLPLKTESLDVLFMNELLEHLEEPAVALKDAARVLKRGGKLIVTVPWQERIRYTLCIHCNRITPINAHVKSFGTEAVERLLKEAGLRVIRIDSLLNKGLVGLRIPLFLKFLPGSVWRLVDIGAGLFCDRWTNICARADKPL